MIEKVRKIIKNGKPLYGRIKLRKDEITENVSPSLNRAKKILKWKAKTNFKYGLSQTINFIQKDLAK